MGLFSDLALGKEAEFEAQSCLTALNLIRSTKLHLSTKPAFLQMSFVGSGFISFVIL
jgi:hypothetical protein